MEEIDYRLIHEALHGPDQVEVTITDEDMRDPSLLNELAEYEGDSDTPKKNSKSLDPTASNPASSSVAKEMDQILHLRKAIADETETYKFFKSEGEKEEAQESLEKIQLMKAELAKLLGEDTHKPEENSQLKLLQDRSNAWRRSALQYKKANNVAEAKKCLEFSNMCKKAIENISSGLPPGFIPPDPEDSTITSNNHNNKNNSNNDNNTNNGSSSSISNGNNNSLAINPEYVQTAFLQPEALIEQQRVQEILALERDIKNQIQKFHELALEAKNKGDKVLAVTLLREKKVFQQDLIELEKTRNFPGAKVPRHHQEAREIRRERVFSKLSPDELEVAVFDGRNLTSKEYPKINPYVEVSMAYPPEKEQKFKTAVVKDSYDPEFRAQHKFIIERNKRSFERFCERKKLEFKIYHSKFFGKDPIIATGELSLENLLRFCEIKERVPLFDGRKQLNSTLEVRVRLRTPLREKHIDLIQEKVTIIDTHYPLPTVIAQPEKVQPQQPPPSKQQSLQSETSKELERLKSIEVLVYLIKQVDDEINKLKSSGAKTETLQQRHALLMQHHNKIYSTLQKGQLTKEEYSKILQTAIEEEKSLAVSLKESNKSEAINALRRAKIMEAEIQRLPQQAFTAVLPKQDSALIAEQTGSSAANPKPVPSPDRSSASVAQQLPTSPLRPASPTVTVTQEQKVTAKDGGKGVAVAGGTAAQQNMKESDDDEVPAEYNQLDWIVSNNVLEWALGETLKKIQQCKSKKQSTDDLEMKKLEIESKMNILVMKVQTGAITMESYVEQLQNKIVEEKALAQKLVKSNPTQAKLALIRAQIMEKELVEEDEE